MRKALAGLILALAASVSPALAQQVVNPQPNAGSYGAYNTSPPTCVAGSGCWLQTDINGQLKVTGSFTAGSAIIGKVGIDQTTPGTTNGVVAFANETNPTSTLTSGTGTAISSSNNFIASSTTAGSIVVPSYTMTTVSGGNALNRRWRLTTNATSGWGATFTVNFWKAAPTYTNGDGAAYAVATGGAGYLGTCSITLIQFGDAASGICAPAIGSEIGFVASGQAIYWDLQATSTLTKTSGQTFTLTAEVLDNK